MRVADSGRLAMSADSSAAIEQSGADRGGHLLAGPVQGDEVGQRPQRDIGRLQQASVLEQLCLAVQRAARPCSTWAVVIPRSGVVHRLDL